MENIEIRQATSKDINQLQSIGKQTFVESFSMDNSAGDMKAYLEKAFSIEKLKMELTNQNSEFYFALLCNAVIGYLKVNFGLAQTEIMSENSLEIERVYVQNEFHGKKVGQMLYEKAMAVSKRKKADYIWLGVWEENPRAIRFYEKNGFAAFDKRIFKLGYDDQTDLMMKLQLMH